MPSRPCLFSPAFLARVKAPRHERRTNSLALQYYPPDVQVSGSAPLRVSLFICAVSSLFFILSHFPASLPRVEIARWGGFEFWFNDNNVYTINNDNTYIELSVFLIFFLYLILIYFLFLPGGDPMDHPTIPRVPTTTTSTVFLAGF